jgi:hypothetical protein
MRSWIRRWWAATLASPRNMRARMSSTSGSTAVRSALYRGAPRSARAATAATTRTAAASASSLTASTAASAASAASAFAAIFVRLTVPREHRCVVRPLATSPAGEVIGLGKERVGAGVGKRSFIGGLCVCLCSCCTCVPYVCVTAVAVRVRVPRLAVRCECVRAGARVPAHMTSAYVTVTGDDTCA